MNTQTLKRSILLSFSLTGILALAACETKTNETPKTDAAATAEKAKSDAATLAATSNTAVANDPAAAARRAAAVPPSTQQPSFGADALSASAPADQQVKGDPNAIPPVPNAGSLPPSSNPDDYIVKVEPADLDLGKIPTNQTTSRKVKLINTGDKPMKIVDARSTCGCTTAQVPRGKVLEPGQAEEFEIGVSGGATPHIVDKQVMIEVENQPLLVMKVHAEVVTFVVQEPVFDPKEMADGKFVLKSTDGSKFKVLSVQPEVVKLPLPEDPAETVELVMDWKKWEDNGSRSALTFYLDHPKCNSLQAQFSQSVREEEMRRNSNQPNFQSLAAKPGLIDAVRAGNVDELKKLLSEGADIEGRDQSYGWTPLIAAAQAGQPLTLKVLIENKANLEATDRAGMTPLMHAAQSGNMDCVRKLISSGASLKATAQTGGSALTWAAGPRGSAEAVKILVEAGAVVDHVDQLGMTPLIWAAGLGEADRVEALINAKANVNAVDFTGVTPLIWAARTGKLQSVDLLLEAGATMDKPDLNGKTALMWAAERAPADSVVTLINHGANVTLKDNLGRTALDYAKPRGDAAAEAVVGALEKAMAAKGVAPDPKPAADAGSSAPGASDDDDSHDGTN